MSVDVVTTANFRKEAKRLMRKYPSLKGELVELERRLAERPRSGTSLGNNCFKIRLAIRSKGRGKSGGARVVTFLLIDESRLHLLSIYDKSEFDTITDKDLRRLIQEIMNRT